MLNTLRVLLLSVLALALSGCGTYRPLYGKGPDGSSVATTLASMSVDEQHSRAGQMLRNQLLDGTAGGKARYNLKLTVTEKIITVANLSSSAGARLRYNLLAHYDLEDSASGSIVTKGDSFSNVEYNTLNIPVSDMQALDNAKQRAATELGQDIRLRLASFISAQKG